jgi:molybdopterin-guanine dinucleotide biosynthesis protein A
MGYDKGLLDITGRPMIQHVIDHLEPICSQILISANTDKYERFGYKVIPDIVHDVGPAGGLVSCLPYSVNRKNIVISCDLPFATTEFMAKLLKLSVDFDITLPKTGPFLQPLCAVYSKQVKDRLKTLVEEGHHSLQYLVRQFTLNIIEQKHLKDLNLALVLRNINYPDDLDSLEK